MLKKLSKTSPPVSLQKAIPLSKSVEVAAFASIHDLLSDPEKLLTLSKEDLTKALEPYFPATRKALLPQEKASKIGLQTRTMLTALQDPTIAAGIEALKKARNK